MIISDILNIMLCSRKGDEGCQKHGEFSLWAAAVVRWGCCHLSQPNVPSYAHADWQQLTLAAPPSNSIFPVTRRTATSFLPFPRSRKTLHDSFLAVLLFLPIIRITRTLRSLPGTCQRSLRRSFQRAAVAVAMRVAPTQDIGREGVSLLRSATWSLACRIADKT